MIRGRACVFRRARLSGNDKMRGFASFLLDDRGTATIEFVIWIPMIAMLLVLATDASTMYLTHTEMWTVARDTARRMTTKNLLTKAEAEAYASAQLTFFEYPYTVNATYDAATAMEVSSRSAWATHRSSAFPTLSQ